MSHYNDNVWSSALANWVAQSTTHKESPDWPSAELSGTTPSLNINASAQARTGRQEEIRRAAFDEQSPGCSHFVTRDPRESSQLVCVISHILNALWGILAGPYSTCLFPSTHNTLSFSMKKLSVHKPHCTPV